LQYWNINNYTYHVTVDEDKKNVRIVKHDSDGNKVGKTVKVSLSKYEECQDRYSVDALYKSKTK